MKTLVAYQIGDPLNIYVTTQSVVTRNSPRSNALRWNESSRFDAIGLFKRILPKHLTLWGNAGDCFVAEFTLSKANVRPAMTKGDSVIGYKESPVLGVNMQYAISPYLRQCLPQDYLL